MEYKLFNEFVQTFLVERKDFLSGSGRIVLTPENLEKAMTCFIENAIEGSDQDFATKLSIQFLSASDEVKILFAHATWLYVYCNRSITPEGKKNAIELSLSGIDGYMLRDDIYPENNGIAHGGTGYNTAKFGSLRFILFLFKWIKSSKAGNDYSSIIKAITNINLYMVYDDQAYLEKSFDPQKLQLIVSDSRALRGTSGKIIKLGVCNFLLNLCEPDYYERIISYNDKRLIATKLFKPEYGSRDGLNIDDQIYVIKQELIKEYPDIDPIYPLRDERIMPLWKNEKKTASRDLHSMERTIDSSLIKDEKTMKDILLAQPLNQILFGPPGTGKTYNSVNMAVEIVDPKFMEESKTRDEIKERYKELVEEGRIVFTTFHQSMCYEDFIEGIKPITSEDQENSLTYEVVPGIFKTICEEAKTQVDYTTCEMHDDESNFPEEERVEPESEMMVRPAPRDVTMNDREALFTESYNALIRDIRKRLQNGEEYKFETMQGAIHSAIAISADNQIKIKRQGSSIAPYIVPKNILRILFVRITDISVISVDKLRKMLAGVKSGSHNCPTYWAITKKLLEISRKLSDHHIDTKPNIDEELASVVSSFVVETSGNVPNVPGYVLIIDEINRGNVSQIFGELITLIEPDKRAGNSEALEVILPYSKEKFSVPPNLYIIGTMNTADRSVEALDTALRRRFCFREMAPDYELLGNADYQGIKLASLLRTINRRIEALLDKDHAIGHSYFLRVANRECSLKDVFFDELIPLLQEYFYGNFGRIELVLGKGFVKSSLVNQSIFAQSSPDNDEYEDHVRYSLIPRKDMDDSAFLKALRVLMKESDEA